MQSKLLKIGITAGLCVLATVVQLLMAQWFTDPDADVCYLAAVVFVAMLYGRNYALAATGAVAAMNYFFFAAPQFSRHTNIPVLALEQVSMLVLLGSLIAWIGGRLHKTRTHLEALQGLLPVCIHCTECLAFVKEGKAPVHAKRRDWACR